MENLLQPYSIILYYVGKACQGQMSTLSYVLLMNRPIKLVFVPGELFKSRLIFDYKPTLEWSSGSCLLTNYRLDWRGLPGTNVLAYLTSY